MDTRPSTPLFCATWTHTHRALFVLFSTPEGVLEQAVQDAAQTERGFDDVGCKFADWPTGGLDDDAAHTLARPCLLDSLNVCLSTVNISALSLNSLPSGTTMVADLCAHAC